MEIFRLFGSIFVNSDEANRSIAKTEGKAEGLSKKLGEGIVAAAKWGAGLAAGAGIGLAAFMKAGESLQDALNALQAQTGSNTDEMNGMKQSLENIYKGNYGESFQDIADSMAQVKQNTGLAGKELENTTKNAIILRDTFDMDVNETTRTAQSLMKQFGITSEQAFNLIAQGAQNGANKNGDLLDSLNEYAPQFKALGLSAEQFTNVLIDGAKNGQFSIDKVGDSVKEFNIRAKDGSKTTVDAFKSLGFNADQMGQKFATGGKTGSEAFKQVVTALNNVKDPVEKNRIGVELFGTQFEDLQGKGISALANIGTTANMTKDTMGQINAVKYDSLGQALQGIGRQIMMGLFDPFNDKVLPKVNEFAKWVTDHMPEIQDGIKKAIDVAVKIFDDLTTAVKFVIDNFNILLPIISGITAAVIAQMVIDRLVLIYKAWTVATETQTTAQWLLTAAMDANPIGLVAAAIGALIAIGIGLYKNWDTVREKTGQLWDKLGSFKGIADLVLGPIGFIIRAAVTMAENWDSTKSVWDNVWNGIKLTASNVVNEVIGSINLLIKMLNKIPGVSIPIIPKVDWGTAKKIASSVPSSSSGKKPTLQHYAVGTNFAPGGTALVGEEGPELVELPKGARVRTAKETNSLLGGARHVTIEAPIIFNDIEIGRAIFPTIDLMQSDNLSTKLLLNGVKG